MRDMISEADYRKRLDRIGGEAFLFFGEEDYLKGHAIRQTREKLFADPTFAAFNDFVLDALDFTPERLTDLLPAPPMMAEYKLIVLRGFDLTRMRAGELDALIDALTLLPQYEHNVVIIEIAAGMIDEGYLPKRPGTVLKKLGEVATPVRFEPPTDAKLVAWVGKHFSHRGITVTPQLCSFLVGYVGRNMFLLAGEIEKLCCYLLSKGRTALGADDVRLVSVPAQRADAFALSNAILDGNPRAALDVLAVIRILMHAVMSCIAIRILINILSFLIRQNLVSVRLIKFGKL